MKKPYTEPNMTIDLFEEVIATGRPPIEQSNGNLHVDSLIDEEEEY